MFFLLFNLQVELKIFNFKIYYNFVKKIQKKMSFLKTMYNIGVNTSSDFSLPVVKSLEKTKVKYIN